MATQEQAFAIEHLTLVHEDLTSEQEDSVLKVLGYVAELEAEVKTLQEAAQWAPLEHRETIGDERWPQTVWVVIGERGFSFCTQYSMDHIRLPDDIRLCRKVQPAT